MLKLTLCSEGYSNVLNYTMSEFVSFNLADIVDCFLELADDGYNLNNILPEAYVESHELSECYAVLKGIKARLQSSMMYSEIKPLYRYALYYMIDSWIEFHESFSEGESLCGIHYNLPDGLKYLITTI